MDSIPTIEMDFQSHSPLVETYPENGSEQESNIPDVDNLQTLAERSLSEIRRQVDSLRSIVAEKDSIHTSVQYKLESQNDELRTDMKAAQDATIILGLRAEEAEMRKNSLFGSLERCIQELKSMEMRCTLAEEEIESLQLENSRLKAQLEREEGKLKAVATRVFENPIES